MKIGASMVVLGAFTLAGCMSTDPGSGSAPGQAVLGQQHYSTNLVNGIVTVDAGEYQYYEFAVPSTASNAQVSGPFRASGGSGNDIVVFIADQTGFINWQNGHSAPAYFNSGKVTVGTISASLSPGTYYLVYENTFSTFSQKDVNTRADLDYYA